MDILDELMAQVEANQAVMPLSFTRKTREEPTPEYCCPTCTMEGTYELTVIRAESEPGRGDGLYAYHRDECFCEQAKKEQEVEDWMAEQKAKKLAERMKQSGLIGRYSDLRLRDVKWHKNQQVAVKTALDFVGEYPGRPGFILSGKNGSGKSHIAAATVRACITAGIRAEFWPSVKLFHKVGWDMVHKESYDYEHPADRFVKLPVLCIDDLGQEKLTDRARDTLYYVVDGRYTMERKTILTTNCTVEELESYVGTAVMSRLVGDCTWVTIGDVPDYRQGGAR
jgi:DNA replication protein DnaC